jgi:hypothetical protein
MSGQTIIVQIRLHVWKLPSPTLADMQPIGLEDDGPEQRLKPGQILTGIGAPSLLVFVDRLA